MLNLSPSPALALRLFFTKYPSLPVPCFQILFVFFSLFRLFQLVECNLLFASLVLPLPPRSPFFPICFFSFSPFFQSSTLFLQYPKSHFTLPLFYPLFFSPSRSLSLSLSSFSHCPDHGMVWPFNISLCFSLSLSS